MENTNLMLQMSFEAWKFQIDAYWTRTSYFALFETALGAGIWRVFEEKHWATSGGLAVGGLAVTAIWIVNNSRLHEYITYYYERLNHFETLKELNESDTIFSRFENHRVKFFPGSYHVYIQVIPILFILGWLWMLFLSVCSICSHVQIISTNG